MFSAQDYISGSSQAFRQTFEEQLKEHSKYNASFLIDLITVVMAMLPDRLPDSVWSKKTVKVSTGMGGIYKSHEFDGIVSHQQQAPKRSRTGETHEFDILEP